MSQKNTRLSSFFKERFEEQDDVCEKKSLRHFLREDSTFEALRTISPFCFWTDPNREHKFHILHYIRAYL